VGWGGWIQTSTTLSEGARSGLEPPVGKTKRPLVPTAMQPNVIRERVEALQQAVGFPGACLVAVARRGVGPLGVVRCTGEGGADAVSRADAGTRGRRKCSQFPGQW
jgi:hypothetical protein